MERLNIVVNSLIANYNIGNVPTYNTTAFMGTSSNQGYSRTHSFTSLPDTVELSTNKKQGLSNGAKIGIGASVLVGLGVLAYALTRGKAGSKQVQQLAEHIEFKPATTMDEAVKFAKEHLGVTLKLEDNLTAANFVNELLTNLNNKMKGKSVLPRKVIFNRNLTSTDGLEGFASWNNSRKQFSFGPKFIKEFEVAQQTEKSYMDLLREYAKKDPYNAQYRIKAIYHEIGHANHFKNCKNAEKMLRLEELKACGCKDTHFTEEFLNEVRNSDVVKKFHCDYALTSPAEFVADTFAYKIMGKEIPKEVEELYVKYGGIPLPA